MNDQAVQYKANDFNYSANKLKGKDSSLTQNEENIQEIQQLAELIANSNTPVALKVKAQKMVERLNRMAKHGSYTGEFELIEKYVDWVTSIPFKKYSKDIISIDVVRKVLDENHYGMQAVKDRIVEYLSVMKLQKDKEDNVKATSEINKDKGEIKDQIDEEKDSSMDMVSLTGNSAHAPVLCFVGIQGIGKTSMAKSIAQAMNRPFVRVALGALGSVVQLRGQSRAFMGAEPGQIIKAIVRSGVSNPIILLDEIDKVSGEESRRFDFMAALLEILDPEQNSTFLDAYIDYPVDLSQVFFICTANNLGTISSALLDRLEVIRFSSYSDDEKMHIAKDYLLPKVRKATGLTEYQLSFNQSVWPSIIRPLGFDAGIRQLERNLTTVARKVASMIVSGEVKSVEISPQNFRQFIPDDIGVYS